MRDAFFRRFVKQDRDESLVALGVVEVVIDDPAFLEDTTPFVCWCLALHA